MIVPVVLLACLLSGSAWAQGRIATVDLAKVIENYWKTKPANAALKNRRDDLEKEFNNLREDLEKAKKEYQKLVDAAYDPVISTEERDKRKKAAEVKLKDQKDIEDNIMQFKRQAETTMLEQQHRMRDNILTDIRTALSAKAKSAGYALLIDTSAKSANNTLELISLALSQNNPADELAKSTTVVLYSSGDNDITDAMLTQLNAGAPLETPKPPEKKEEKKDEKK
jgi:Skp family chaperone for outer membrane proteins